MTEVFHERLKSPIPGAELERRTRLLQAAMKREGIDGIISQNITQYMGGCNRWLTDTLAENNYPQSTILPCEGEIGYIACSGPPLDLYPPSHLLRIGKPYAAAPYFSPFNFTNSWEGRFAVQWIKDHNAKKIAVSGREMIYWNYYEYIKNELPEVEIVDASSLFDVLRAEKSEDEIVFIRKSAAVLDKVMGYMCAFCQPGVREYEIRSKIMELVTMLGGEEMVITISSAPRGEAFALKPSFYQNRTLCEGDYLYIRMACSGPGGLFTTLGRMFSVGREPSAQMLADWDNVVTAQNKLVSMLAVGANPQVVFAQYNTYLESIGCQPEKGMFAHGQGYDFIERPSMQHGETLLLGKDMCLAVNTNLVSPLKSFYCADSFLLKPDGAVRLSKMPQVIVRT